MPALLPYTRQRVFAYTANVLRNTTAEDQYGGKRAGAWQQIASVSCAFYWMKESTRGPSEEYPRPETTVSVTVAGVLLPEGTDVTTEDRLVVRDDQGAELTAAMDITTVLPFPGDFIQVIAHNPA